MADEEKRGRKPVARDAAVVLGCIEERLGCLDSGDLHVARLFELLDELRRAIANNKRGKDERE